MTKLIVYREQITQDNRAPVGEFLEEPWKIPETPFAHVKHYASSIFEGIRVIYDPKRKKFFAICLDAHVERFFDSMKFMNLRDHEDDKIQGGITVQNSSFVYYPYDQRHVYEKILATIIRNIQTGAVRKDGCYVRPNMYRGDLIEGAELSPTYGLAPLQRSVVLEISAKPWGKYLARPPRVIVAPHGIEYYDRRKKCGGNYALAARLKSWAERNGFDETMLTDPSKERKVLELTGQNIFGFGNGKIVTPSLDQCVLPGTKRALLIEMLQISGNEVEERHIPLEEFINAEAAGCSGTASGFLQIGSVQTPDKKSNYRELAILMELIIKYEKLISGEKVDRRFETLQERIRTPIDF